MWCWPKPVQKPHPPVHLGGSGPGVLKRVVAYADGWMPNRGNDLARIPELQELAREAGRERIPVTLYPKAVPGAIEEAAEAGVDRCIYYVPSDGRDQALTRLEELAKLAAPYRE
jgi:alkanesulfonate monooxygenase SsuD/methylene tetrahydromethanopterin reductase-like flavin-dependent oxidoreductase (luciferase family)